MAAAAAAGVLAALGSVAAMMQSRANPSAAASSPRIDTSTAAIAAAATPESSKAAQRNARDERLMALITDPLVLGTIVTIGGIALSANMPFHRNPKVNGALRSLAAASCVLMGLGRAGVGDLTTMTMAGGTALAVGSEGLSDSLGLEGQDPGESWWSHTWPILVSGGTPIGPLIHALKE